MLAEDLQRRLTQRTEIEVRDTFLSAGGTSQLASDRMNTVRGREDWPSCNPLRSDGGASTH